MKTFDDCKKEVAKKQGWGKLVMGHAVKHFDEAAQTYAEQEAIAFAEWIVLNDYEKDIEIDGEVVMWVDEDKLLLTTQELYDKFKAEKP